MSKMGQEVRSLMYDDQGEPIVYQGHMTEDGVYIPSPEEEAEIQAEMRLVALANYSIEELEAEIDSRCTGTGGQ